MSFSVTIPPRLAVLRGAFPVSPGLGEETKRVRVSRHPQPLLSPACSRLPRALPGQETLSCRIPQRGLGCPWPLTLQEGVGFFYRT